MGGGGGHGVEVWTPTGGAYCDPKLWRRNTAIALLGIAAVCVPIAIASARMEVRSHSCLHRAYLFSVLCVSAVLSEQQLSYHMHYGVLVFARLFFRMYCCICVAPKVCAR